MQRRMARVLFPEAELFGGLNFLRQSFQTAAKLAAAERFYGHSSVNPAWWSPKARRFISSSFPAAASAFICLSHSSSGSRGYSSAINSQYSCGESLAMAALISATVDMNKHYKTPPAKARAVSFISLFFSGNGGAKFSSKCRKARD